MTVGGNLIPFRGGRVGLGLLEGSLDHFAVFAVFGDGDG